MRVVQQKIKKYEGCTAKIKKCEGLYGKDKQI